MLEYKTEKCDPEDLDAICQALQVWGWKLEQTQEVYNENTEILSNETHLVGRFIKCRKSSWDHVYRFIRRRIRVGGSDFVQFNNLPPLCNYSTCSYRRSLHRLRNQSK